MLDRARKHNFKHFDGLLVLSSLLEDAGFHLRIIKTMLAPLTLLLLLIIAHHLSRQLLSLPKRMDNLIRMAVHQSGKGKLFINVLALVLSLNCYTLDLRLPQLSD